jgi:L-alanine-DL-glutamate epimerase-like enolase superfamily enzyme
MKIRSIRCAGLRGATPEGGWSNELKRDDCVHTLVAVQTDEGLTGIGSVFTSDHLVRAALKLLEPLLLGEHALEPERVTEKLHQHTFWQGRGGSVTHRSAESTLHCGTCSGRPRVSRWGDCWADATANAFALTLRC